MAGRTTIIDLTATVADTGTFTGTSIVRGILIFHPDGSATFHDIETFTGTVNGKSGTVTFRKSGTVTFQQVCGRTFYARRSDAKTHDGTCRATLYRRARRRTVTLP